MRRLGILGLLLWASSANAGPGYYAPGPVSTGKVANVNVNLSSLGLTIPSNFVGYSINTSAVINGLLTGSGSLCSLAGLLGTNGVLRIGGSDQDTTPSAPALTQNIANNLEAFRACLGTGWTLIYGLDAAINNSATAATQAGFINTASGTKAVYQFGNEPVASGNFTIGSYQTMWNSYQTAVVGAVASAKLAAWDDYSYGSTQTVINGLTGGLAGLTFVTQHFYNTCSTSIPASQLLGSIAYNTFFNQIIFQNNNWAAASSVPIRMAETNTICGGGVLGVSDRMMSAAWFLNEAILLAKAGWGGVNIHNNLWWPASGGSQVVGTANPNSYGALLWNATDSKYYPGAIFYGMFLFSKIAGQQTANVVVNGDGNALAIATKGGNGNANIIVVNNDANGSTTITPSQSSAWTTANVLQMKGNGGCSEASPTVGGQPIGESGVWTGTTFAISNGASITLGPCEAALIQIQP